MKHSTPVKFPSKYLIFVTALCLVGLIIVGGFIYLKWQASQTADSSKHQSIVNQLNRSQFDNAYQALND